MVSIPQHTPGPWTFDNAVAIARIMKGGFVIVKMRKLAHTWDEQVANGHLISAAPDMLEALKAVALARNTNDMDDWARATHLIDAAITKAEG